MKVKGEVRKLDNTMYKMNMCVISGVFCNDNQHEISPLI